MPQMGYDMEEGTVVRWLSQEGASVTTGQAIAAWGESERGNHGPTPDAGGKLVKRSDECPGSRPVELPERDAGRPARWPSRH